MKTQLDLEPGIYALSSLTGLDVFITDDSCISAELLATGKRVRLYVPEGGSFEVHTKLFPPRVKALQLTDPVDPIPHEGLLTEPQPLTLQEQIARFIGAEMARQNSDVETMEEADDFELDDMDDMPLSRYEHDLEVAIPETAPAHEPDEVAKGPKEPPTPPTTDQPKTKGKAKPDSSGESGA